MSDEEVQESEVAEVESPESEGAVEQAPEQAAAESAGQEQGQQDIWSAFRGLPQFNGQDDTAIASRLYEALQREDAAARALQQYQSIIPVASEYLSNRELYEQWKANQQAPQQQQQIPQPAPKQEQAGWWNPPTVKDSYRRYLTRDENGREIISPEAPLDAKAALQDYMEYRANFAQKFLDNPEQTLGPMVEKVAMQRAEQIVDQRLSRMKDENYVQELESQNRDWLFDQSGNVSAEGLAVQKYIQDAKTMGISGAQARWDYATRMVERDLLLSAMQRAQQPQQQPAPAQMPVAQQPTPAQKNMEYLRQQAMRTASQRPAATTDARTPSKSMTFEEKLLAQAQENGLI